MEQSGKNRKFVNSESQTIPASDESASTGGEECSGEVERLRGRATGPRTNLGKQRASRNATKHAVFSKAILVKGESRADYKRLWEGLRSSKSPEGGLEELLVEKLVICAWRQRRLLSEQGREISLGSLSINLGARSLGLDLLVRYEASLERAFDRTLSQLERLQATRRGEPVPPKIEIEHTLS